MSAVHTETIHINFDEHTSKSHLACPADQETPRPGVLVIPEFWGLTDYIKSRANALAELGYSALAVDIYGEGWTANTAEEATNAMNRLFADMEKTSERMRSYLNTLKNLKQTDETKTASIGYCLGGALSLHLARLGADVTGVVSFHGDLDPQTAIQAGQVKAKILVCHGEADAFILEEKVKSFKKEMEDAGVDYQFIGYPNAHHGFTNPKATENGKKFDIPTAYDEKADQSSWEEMQKFFHGIFN
ncbi:MAG: dienelactone hydrolase family protein [Bdellovibrionales bacterium]|nr:dienelactone hydrolase family protein [Bdellovibrionales bacterium]